MNNDFFDSVEKDLLESRFRRTNVKKYVGIVMAIQLFVAACVLAFWGGVGYLILHFVFKYW